MKLMILATALALSTPALADDAHHEAQLTTFELVVTLDNIAEEAKELSDLAARRGKLKHAKALENLADSSQTLADKIDLQTLSPLERDATFAYARAQLGRLKSDFDLMDNDAGDVKKKSRYLAAELDHARTIHRELKDALAKSDRGRDTRNDVVSR